jgi:hypothetical protein
MLFEGHTMIDVLALNAVVEKSGLRVEEFCFHIICQKTDYCSGRKDCSSLRATGVQVRVGMLAAAFVQVNLALVLATPAPAAPASPTQSGCRVKVLGFGIQGSRSRV